MCFGSRRCFSAMVRIEAGRVAENSTLWRLAGMAWKITSRSSMKPSLSISSASSSTRWLMVDSSWSLRLRWSTRRPGVATMTWAPMRMALSCGPIGAPP
ncbi:hypothetical protein D3C78_1710340 [compost metagenome]